MSREITKDLFPSFINYTDEMYLGNKPCGKGHNYLLNGNVIASDRWETKYGGGETIGDKIKICNFHINEKISIYITYGVLNIVDTRYSGKTDQWLYCSNPSKGRIFGCSESNLHQLEDEKIEKILNVSIPNCKFWSIVKGQAKYIYYKEKSSREF